MDCKICQKPFVARSHKHLICSIGCTEENKRRISLESYYRVKGDDIPKRERTYNTDFPKVSKREQRAKYRAKNKDKIKQRSRDYNAKSYNTRKNYHLKKHFNITLDEYNNLLELQDHSCKICLNHESTFTKKLAVDHCHSTGKIRGLLCDNCNRSIGMLKDSIEILQNAINYLKKSQEDD